MARRAAPAPLHDRRDDRRRDSRPRPVAGVSAGDIGHVPLDIDEARLASSVRHFFVKGEILHETVEHYPGLVFWLLVAGFAGRVPARADERRHSIDPRSPDRHVRARRAHDERLDRGRHGRVHRARRADAVRFSGRARGRLHRRGRPAGRSDHDRGAQRSGSGPLHDRRMWASLVLCQSDRRAWGAFAGTLAGIATAIKYSSMFAVVPALIAALARGTTTARLSEAALVLGGFIVSVAGDEPFSVERFSELHPPVVRANRADRQRDIGRRSRIPPASTR